MNYNCSNIFFYRRRIHWWTSSDVSSYQQYWGQKQVFLMQLLLERCRRCWTSEQIIRVSANFFNSSEMSIKWKMDLEKRYVSKCLNHRSFDSFRLTMGFILDRVSRSRNGNVSSLNRSFFLLQLESDPLSDSSWTRVCCRHGIDGKG